MTRMKLRLPLMLAGLVIGSLAWPPAAEARRYRAAVRHAPVYYASPYVVRRAPVVVRAPYVGVGVGYGSVRVAAPRVGVFVGW